MLADAYLPSPMTVPLQIVERYGARYAAALWTPGGLGELMAALRRGGRALSELPDDRLLGAWGETVEAFLDQRSAERRGLDDALVRMCRLSPAGLAAGLEAVLGGVRREAAGELLARVGGVWSSRGAGSGPGGQPLPLRQEAAAPVAATAAAGRLGPVVVVLASNLPALAVQPLLPSLALRRPVLLKSPSAEPLFAPAFLSALARRQPALAGAMAAATWRGGDPLLEAPVLAGAAKVLAYGEEEALADLGRRAPGRVVGYGPKLSVAVVGAGTDPAAAAPGLARDVALFDQRGCLSITAVYTTGDAAALARWLAAALADLALRWPPGPVEPQAAAAVQQARLEAEMRGLQPAAGWPAVACGTVLLEPEPALCPSPGLRTVRIHPLDRLDRLTEEILPPWRGKLQGAALAGEEAWRLAPGLAALGVSRCAPPGELQSPSATWHNGGVDPLHALTC
ncbi:MAG TPA: acyl-CoA reductase [Thermoanaerobaculia bacterium]|nr:acyl-CoA reductase [Thermoanaerobaculia bacterium]